MRWRLGLWYTSILIWFQRRLKRPENANSDGASTGNSTRLRSIPQLHLLRQLPMPAGAKERPLRYQLAPSDIQQPIQHLAGTDVYRENGNRQNRLRQQSCHRWHNWWCSLRPTFEGVEYQCTIFYTQWKTINNFVIWISFNLFTDNPTCLGGCHTVQQLHADIRPRNIDSVLILRESFFMMKLTLMLSVLTPIMS